MAPSIPSPLITPGHLSGIFSLFLPKGGAFAKIGQPGDEALSKQRYISDFKSRTQHVVHFKFPDYPQYKYIKREQESTCERKDGGKKLRQLYGTRYRIRELLVTPSRLGRVD